MHHFLVWIATAGLVVEVLVYLAALIGVAFHYVGRARARGAALSMHGFLRHLCPPELLASRWTYGDFLYYVANLTLGLIIYPVAGALTVLCAGLVVAGLQQVAGGGPGLPLNVFTLAAFLAIGLLARDFLSFYLHVMQHRVPLLWEFHKVHHAPEHLIPITGHRLHPLELCVNLAGDAPLLGVLVGVFAWLVQSGLGQSGVELLILCSAGLQVLIGTLTLAPLRHSHIDIRFGRAERYILSPAHHRLHHSCEPEHWDKNFSAVFPFWDRAWHTFLPPPASDTYRLGLPGDESAAYASVLSSHMQPFRSALRRARAEGWATVLRVGALANQRSRSGTSRLPLQSETAADAALRVGRAGGAETL